MGGGGGTEVCNQLMPSRYQMAHNMPRRSTSGFHGPRRHRVHQALGGGRLKRIARGNKIPACFSVWGREGREGCLFPPRPPFSDLVCVCSCPCVVFIAPSFFVVLIVVFGCCFFFRFCCCWCWCWFSCVGVRGRTESPWGEGAHPRSRGSIADTRGARRATTMTTRGGGTRGENRSDATTHSSTMR